MLFSYDRACFEVSEGGFGLKIGAFLTEIRPGFFLHKWPPLLQKMQLDVDVSPPAISLLVDMNPKC